MADSALEKETLEEDTSTKLRLSRGGKMSHLTRQMNIVNKLMADAQSISEVKENMAKFNVKLDEFKTMHIAYQHTLCAIDKSDDMKSWYTPRMEEINQFVSNVSQWISNVESMPTVSSSQAALPSEDPTVGLSFADDEDKRSVASMRSHTSARSQSSARSHASVSSTRSARICAEAEQAALMEKFKALEKRHSIEHEEEQLQAQMQQQKDELRKKKEKLEMQTELNANKAKLQYLRNAEKNPSDVSTGDAMNDYLEENRPKPTVRNMPAPTAPTVRLKDNVTVQFPFAPTAAAPSSRIQAALARTPAAQTAIGDTRSYAAPRTPFPQTPAAHAALDGTRPYAAPHTPYSQTPVAQTGVNQSSDGITRILETQNRLTSLLIKQQSLTTLPKGNIEIFDGNVLQYKAFIHWFDHIIEAKTDNYSDRLLFLIQYTRGKAQELVKSCQLINDTKKAYRKARKLLDKHFGNDYRISCAYINKALSWPTIKNEDVKALLDFALFLRSCCNAMENVEYMEELDTISNMKNIVLKLPYKWRERWRVEACKIQETNIRVRMTDLVSFIEKQATIVSDPVFGDIQDASTSMKTKAPAKPPAKGSFTTNVNVTSTAVPSATTCLFCTGQHNLETCKQFETQQHRDKIAFLKQNGICFGCLTKAGHISKDCAQRLTCSICTKRHPSALHIAVKTLTSQQAVSSSIQASSGDGGKHAGAGSTHKTSSCAMSIVPVQVKSNKDSRVITTYAFLDHGSSATFCTEKLMHKLNIPGKKTNILLKTMNQEKPVDTYLVKGLEVSALKENNFIALPETYTQNSMPVDTKNIPKAEELRKWTYLNEVQLPTLDADVEILIGNNAPKALEPWNVINSHGDGPYAVKTLLGWVINGPLEATPTANTGECYAVTVNRISVEKLEKLLVQQYNHDFNEVVDDKEMSMEDRRFLKIAEQSIRLQNGHYSLNLPFRVDCPVMPNNYQVAEQRLASLRKKFKRNEQFRCEYTEFMDDVINKGHAEVVPQAEIQCTDGRLWYLPHHGIYHPKKGTIRVVFDCGATYHGASLNAALLQGPDLTSTLIGVLTRFRQHPVALMADIKSMFHQVRVSRGDVDFLRFLWWPNGDTSLHPVEYRMTVHIFGAVSSPSCANFALRQTAKDNQGTCSADVVSTIERNFYVDDCLKSLETEEQAVELMRELTCVCHKGGFHLTKWVSNSRTVLAHVPTGDRATEIKELDLDKDKLPTERALGLLWSVENDSFRFNISIPDKAATRRNILSMVSSIYDPLGFLCPLTLPAKLLLQDLCRLKCSWDQPIPQACAERWRRWATGLDELQDFSVKRCVKPSEAGASVKAELHHFSDASEQGYGTVSYMRLHTETHNVHIAFMLGKARVAPLKQMTVPRMELVAATLAVRVDMMIRKELEIELNNSTFWTDSQSVLKYIGNEHTRFRTFVANRIAVIRENTNVSQWRFIGTKINPADVASRGVKATAFVKCSEWLNGPDFLWTSESEWPQNPLQSLPLAEDDVEVKRKTICIIAVQTSHNPTWHLLHHYSSWTKLKRAVVVYLKLKDYLLLKTKRKKHDVTPQTRSQIKARDDEKKTLMGHCISIDDLQRAEKAIVGFCQQQMYPEDMAKLKTPAAAKTGLSRKSTIYRLDPVLEDGILRVGGRLKRAAMPEEAKRPMILPKNLHVSTLILRNIHEQLGHAGRNHMLSQLRKRYWIVNANSAARKVLSQCVTCRCVKGKRGEQKMADLPKERLEVDLPPFSNVGVDYFGPFETKRGRSLTKRYGVIFTCMSSRAVHLEMAYALDTDSCINALRRFISRRGQVTHIRSDNGTNLVGAKKDLQNAIAGWNSEKINNAMLQKGIQWSFNPPAASHHGGVWERLIRMVRQVLLSTIKEQTLDDECLQTLFCEIEAILNSRPITTVSDDNHDLEALTPNHILLLKCHPSLPPGLFQHSDMYTRRRWKQVQYLANLFWRRWTKEYLPLLQERQKWTRMRRDFTVGGIVMVVDSTAPRGSWVLGRVEEVLPDSKGLVRTVKIRTKTGVYERPVTKLCMLLEST